MIKIIKDGEDEFVAKCPTCGCEFSYELMDISIGLQVECPCCGYYVPHIVKRDNSNMFEVRTAPLDYTSQTTADWVAPDVIITASTPKRRVTKTTNWFANDYSETELQEIKGFAMKECEEAGI